MTNIKHALLALALAGLVGCYLPLQAGISFYELGAAGSTAGARADVYVTMGGFLLAAAAALVAIFRPPLRRLHAILVLAGFAVVLVKLRAALVDMLRHGQIGARFMCIAAAAGVIIAVIAIAKPTPETLQ